jgi:branched-chain amino acid aminotransferase
VDERFSFQPNPSPLAASAREAVLANPGFGRVFTDHMAVIHYEAGRGWYEPTVKARGPFAIDPACAVLHYAQEIFEGMKAYRTEAGEAVLFRPMENARRFNASAQRMSMAQIPEDLFLAAVRALVEVDGAWIPAIGEGSLYLRPFMFASGVYLGVKPSNDYIFAVIASPAGAYFNAGSGAITIWASDAYSRAAPGGTGAAKCGGNYAGSLVAQAEATEAGCDQVLFLDAAEHRWVEELGGMNIFFVFEDGSLCTPPLGGTILPGITRDALITLARGLGHAVREAPYALDQWRADAQSGRLVEAFACGTAAVVAPIGHVKGRNLAFSISEGRPGPVAAALRAALVDIQHGRAADTHGWVERVA